MVGSAGKLGQLSWVSLSSCHFRTFFSVYLASLYGFFPCDLCNRVARLHIWWFKNPNSTKWRLLVLLKGEVWNWQCYFCYMLLIEANHRLSQDLRERGYISV